MKLIEGVDVYIYVQIQNLKDSKAEKHWRCKGETRLSKLQHHKSTKTSIILLQNSNFIAIIASVELFQYTLPRPKLAQK